MHPNISHSVALYKLSVSIKRFEKYSTGCQVAPYYYYKTPPAVSLGASDLNLMGSAISYTLSTGAVVSQSLKILKSFNFNATKLKQGWLSYHVSLWRVQLQLYTPR